MRPFATVFQDALAAPLQDRILGPLAVTIAGLLLLSFAFTGYAIGLRLVTARTARRRSRLEGVWREAILAAIARGERGASLSGVRVRDQPLLAETLLDYSRRLRGQEREIVHDLARPLLPGLLPLLSHPNPYRRARAIQIVGALGLPEHAEELLRALADSSDLVAMLAARALARHGAIEHAVEVGECIARFETWSAGYLSSLLVEFGAAAIPTLRALLEDRARTARVRTVTAHALMELHDLPSSEIAARLLQQGERDTELVGALLALLRTLGRPDQVDVVRGFLSSPDPVLRGFGFRTLGALGGERDIAVLLDGVADPSPWAALHAARGLRQLGRDDLLRALVAKGEGQSVLAAQVLQEGWA